MTEGYRAMPPGEYRFVILWAVGLLLLYAVGGYFGAGLLREYAAETARTRQALIASATTEPNRREPTSQLPVGAKPVAVTAGGRINDIGEFSLRESGWTADFNLWFNWSGDAVKPGAGFRVVNGEILKREKVDSYHRGTEHYEEYHVVARITKHFDASRFPFAEEGLFIQIEDATQGAEALRYVADERNSSVATEAMPRAVKLTGFLVGTRIGSFRSGRVDPGHADGMIKVRSQLFLAMLGKPDSMGVYIKTFQALFAAVAVALIVLFIKPIHVDPRFGVPVGGFFAAVGNNIYVGAILPHSDRHTLADMVNATGLLTIFLILVQSAVALFIEDSLNNERLRRLFDHVSFAVFLLGYLAVNIVLPLAARAP